MKKILSVFFLFQFALLSNGTEVFKTINCTAGNLHSLLTSTELSSITNLTISGNIDARDFKIMRDSMTNLSVIDLTNSNILSYTGTEGTDNDTQPTTYSANTIPFFAFSISSNNSNRGKTTLKTINLPTGTITIGSYAFWNCDNLDSVKLPSSLSSIQNSAFDGCTSLRSITIPTSVVEIYFYAFRNCTSLSQIKLSAKMTSLFGGDVFVGSSANIEVDGTNPEYSSENGVLFDKTKTILYFCPSSKTGAYIVPSSVTRINADAFRQSNLSTVVVPSSVDSIGGLGFYDSKTSIVVETGNKKYCSINGILFNNDTTNLIYCPKTISGSYTIPLSVKSVTSGAFHGCSDLTTVKIPASVTSIGSQTFSGCSGLASIYSYAKNPILSSAVSCSNYISIFYLVDVNKCSLYVPKNSKALYRAANEWKEFTNIVEFDPSLGVKDIEQTPIKICRKNSSVNISGINIGDKVLVYNTLGAIVFNEYSASNSIDVSLNAHGIYIVKVNDRSIKTIY